MSRQKKPKQKKKLPPGMTLGDVVLYGGRAVGTLLHESDPDGHSVVHAYRRDTYAHERLRKSGMLSAEQYEAAERFRADFERGGLGGNYARLSETRTGAGDGTPGEACIAARERVRRALAAVGRNPQGRVYTEAPLTKRNWCTASPGQI